MDVIEYIKELNLEATYFTGMDKCIVGTHEGPDGTVLVYDYNLIIDLYIEEGMSEEEALEFYDFNLERTLPYMGKSAPIVITLIK